MRSDLRQNKWHGRKSPSQDITQNIVEKVVNMAFVDDKGHNVLKDTV